MIFLLLVLVFFYQIFWLNNFYKEQSAKMEVDIMAAMKNADAKLRSFSQNSFSTENIDFPNYANLLQIELVQKGIALETYTQIIDLNRRKTVKSIPDDVSGISKGNSKSFIYPFDEEGNYAYKLVVKELQLYVLKQMTGILGASLLMIVLLFLSYIYLLKVILKQKTLDEIKSDFVNNMTHELKTPISVAYAATDALQNYGMMDDPGKRDEYLKVSKEQLTHLNGLVEQILVMSVEERRNMKLSLEIISLSALFQQLKNQYLLNATKNVVFDIDVTPEDLTIKADKIHFQNVIGNLIENAVKYSKEEVNIILSAKKEKEQILIKVQDNGIGVPSAALPRIFDRFYRVSTGNIHNVKGYGLGLFYVKTIVEKHKGTIKAESKLGEGTTFYIEF